MVAHLVTGGGEFGLQRASLNFAMPCASTFDAACAAREATDPGQLAHAVASTSVGVGRGRDDGGAAGTGGGSADGQ